MTAFGLLFKTYLTPLILNLRDYVQVSPILDLMSGIGNLIARNL